ncbi:MAG: hypothetical protein IPN69_03500 [Acidobacteria bacterium]|nr:hypothetical protein [Acidobacteriota bacterium]
MKFLFVVAFVLSCALFGFAQSDTSGIEIYVAKDNGDGKAGDPVEAFSSSDVPIYCIVTLSSVKATTVKMNFIAVGVKGVKPETKAFSTSYTTNGKENQVNFTGKPGGDAWVAGTYRIDIYVDGQLAGSKAFPITGATAMPAAQTNFTESKPKPKPRRSKKP